MRSEATYPAARTLDTGVRRKASRFVRGNCTVTNPTDGPCLDSHLPLQVPYTTAGPGRQFALPLEMGGSSSGGEEMEFEESRSMDEGAYSQYDPSEGSDFAARVVAEARAAAVAEVRARMETRKMAESAAVELEESDEQSVYSQCTAATHTSEYVRRATDQVMAEEAEKRRVAAAAATATVSSESDVSSDCSSSVVSMSEIDRRVNMAIAEAEDAREAAEAAEAGSENDDLLDEPSDFDWEARLRERRAIADAKVAAGANPVEAPVYLDYTAATNTSEYVRRATDQVMAEEAEKQRAKAAHEEELRLNRENIRAIRSMLKEMGMTEGEWMRTHGYPRAVTPVHDDDSTSGSQAHQASNQESREATMSVRSERSARQSHLEVRSQTSAEELREATGSLYSERSERQTHQAAQPQATTTAFSNPPTISGRVGELTKSKSAAAEIETVEVLEEAVHGYHSKGLEAPGWLTREFEVALAELDAATRTSIPQPQSASTLPMAANGTTRSKRCEKLVSVPCAPKRKRTQSPTVTTASTTRSGRVTERKRPCYDGGPESLTSSELGFRVPSGPKPRSLRTPTMVSDVVARSERKQQSDIFAGCIEQVARDMQMEQAQRKQTRTPECIMSWWLSTLPSDDATVETAVEPIEPTISDAGATADQTSTCGAKSQLSVDPFAGPQEEQRHEDEPTGPAEKIQYPGAWTIRGPEDIARYHQVNRRDRKIDRLMEEQYGEEWRIRNTAPERPTWFWRAGKRTTLTERMEQARQRFPTPAPPASAALPTPPTPVAQPTAMATAPRATTKLERTRGKGIRYWYEQECAKALRTEISPVASVAPVAEEQKSDSLEDVTIVDQAQLPTVQTANSPVPFVAAWAEEQSAYLEEQIVDPVEDVVIDQQQWTCPLENAALCRSAWEQETGPGPEAGHSTGSTETTMPTTPMSKIETILTSVKDWCSRTWTTVKNAIWG
ncbi:hypothetical protein B0A50_08601 [Salinomyces thailandicus]|uniref:Uncharacterized protein n=1 Tax=Salinomyces thailandicus TaxID=706561 RepID=A0A4U0TJD0_9PEZI|nr:hypothetical protein B0A50_08601 [Salinomyces thailandica]